MRIGGIGGSKDQWFKRKPMRPMRQHPHFQQVEDGAFGHANLNRLNGVLQCRFTDGDGGFQSGNLAGRFRQPQVNKVRLCIHNRALLEMTAQGVLDIINAKMADAIRTITIRRGIDPRDFSLGAFGGAGPEQAAALAEELQIKEVIVPVYPGAFFAWGMLQTDVRHDFKETLNGFWDLTEPATLSAAFAALSDKGRTYLLAEGIAPDAISFDRAIDFRYHGQEYVMTIPLPDGEIDMGAVRTAFDLAYDRQYGHSSPEARVEMANIRLVANGRLPRPVNAPPARQVANPPRQRQVHFAGSPLTTAILDRNDIWEGAVVNGPAIIEEGTATTLLPPGWQARLVTGGHLSLTRTGAAA